MSKLLMGLIILSALCLVLAAAGSFFGLNVIGVSPEASSRASNNLALIAIALAVCIKRESAGN
jgi:hypothetical protein